ncbi:hypothetical protein EPN42_01245 [bacterium]|nr:MAG: hypothetical protein EPN42_01245 [bacterium]
MTDWKNVARDEHLLEGFDNARLELLGRVLTLLPDDPSRILFLRYANEHHIQPDSPHMTSILLMLAFTARMLVNEIEQINGSTKQSLTDMDALVGRTEEAIRKVGEAAIQVLDRTTHLRAHSETIATKMDAIANSLPERFGEVIHSFDDILQRAVAAKVEAAQTAAFDASIKPKLADVTAGLDVLHSDLTSIAEKLVPVAVQAKNIIASEPYVLGRVKLNRVAATLAAATLVAGIALGGALGFAIGKPSPVTMTPQMVRTFDQGAAYAKIWPQLTRAQQAAIQRELAAPQSAP